MSSSSSRRQMLYTLGFLCFLLSAFAAFFTGVKVGADKTEAKYESLAADDTGVDSGGSYSQQDLVSFYHNVFLPFREFKREWDGQTARLSRGSGKEENAAILKNLGILADKESKKITQNAVFVGSPLLEKAQLNILKSLKLFGQAADKASVMTSGAETAKALKSGEFAAGALKYGLQGQKQYYDSMLKWGSSKNGKIAAEVGELKLFTFVDWKKMPLLQKNAVIASLMVNRGIFAGYDPQDVTAKIDDLIYSGTASALKLTNVQAAVSLLVSTGAINEEDFMTRREQYYARETLPQLPFFYE